MKSIYKIAVIKYIFEAINPKSSRSQYQEDNFGKERIENSAVVTPDKKYIIKDKSKVTEYKENDGGSFPSSEFTGPAELSGS